MRLLVGDVASDLFDLRLADGKRAVARLPVELAKARALRLDPFGRAFLDVFDQIGNRPLAGEREERMYVIFVAIDDERGRIVAFEDRRQIRVQFRFNLRRQPRLAVFGAEDQMHQDRRKGLRHERPPFLSGKNLPL